MTDAELERFKSVFDGLNDVKRYAETDAEKFDVIAVQLLIERICGRNRDWSSPIRPYSARRSEA
jgi:hypothetical protein